MVERTDLVPLLGSTLGATPPAATLPSPGGSILALPSGDVAARLRHLGATRRRATYELLIVNGSSETVAAYTRAVSHAAGAPGAAQVWQGALVPAFSSVTVCVDVARTRHGETAPVVAELRAAGTRLIIAAPPAGDAQTQRGKPLPGMLALATVVIATLGLGIVHGKSPDGAGAPKSFAGHRPAKVMAAHRHHASPQRRLAATQPAVPPLQVAGLQVPASVRSGESVSIDYTTAGTDGTVALVDESGRTVARTALDSRGVSVLVAPNVVTAQDFDVVIAARRDGQRAQAVAPLFVRPAEPRPKPQARASAPPAPGTIPAAGAATQNGSVDADAVTVPIGVAAVQSVGRPIVVRVLAHPRALHLSLFAAGGTPLAERDVPKDAANVVFPALTKARELSLITTYDQGSGEESTITPISIR